jgi:1-pyrroline-5-carboxylate dehydrogenase
MTMAAVVTGNTTVLKPSPDAPTIAYKFIEILEEIGLPKGVVNFVPGSGTKVGELLVQSPKIRFVSFTGSKAVGLHIYEEAAKTREGQRWMKRVVAEMGGKDAIIVDEEADLDSAATGVVQAAFGFQGQKCSACSRLIVDEKVHDELMEKVVALTKELKIGLPTEAETNMSAVINQKSFDNALKAIRKDRKKAEN